MRKGKERKEKGKKQRRKKAREADVADRVYSSWQQSKHFVYSPLQRDEGAHMPGALSLRPPALNSISAYSQIYFLLFFAYRTMCPNPHD